MTSATEIKERPILFSTPMVRAILEGRKTQTRRAIKPQPRIKGGLIDESDSWMELNEPDLMSRFPYGKISDRLWVREAWRPRSWGSDFDWMMIEYKAGGSVQQIDPSEVWGDDADVVWEKMSVECHALGNPQSGSGDFVLDKPLKWRSSIFMPRAASRVTLEITNIRVERVQDISEEDAISEGVDSISIEEVPRNGTLCRRDDFAQLWNSINNDRGYGWNSNPWVWVVEFNRVEEARSLPPA